MDYWDTKRKPDENVDILELCDEYVYIPMSDVCESLNVGVATSILLYELSK